VKDSWTTASGRSDQTEEVALDWAYSQENTFQHHTPSPAMEPPHTREEENWASKKLLAAAYRGRVKEHQHVMA